MRWTIQVCTVVCGNVVADRVRKAFQPIDHGDENVIDATAAMFIEDSRPKFRAFRMFDPGPQHVARTVGQDRQCPVVRIVTNNGIVLDLHAE